MARPEQVPVTGIHPARGYAHAWRVGDMMFISGQVAQNQQGEVVGKGDIREQTHQVFRNLRTVLGASGATFRDIVKLNIYCTDAAGIPGVREVRMHYLEGHTPSSTLVVVDGLALPDYLVEIEAVAVLPDRPA